GGDAEVVADRLPGGGPVGLDRRHVVDLGNAPSSSALRGAHLLPPVRQFSRGSSGIRASSRYWSPMRSSTVDHSFSGSLLNTSPGRARSMNHASSSTSSSSCPVVQPA